MSNTITIELCKEDRQRLDELICFTSWIASVLKSKSGAPAEEPQEAQEAPKLEVVKNDHPVDAVPPHDEPEAVAPVEEPKPTVTLDQIRQKVTALLADATKKAAVRDIVKAYAPNVTGLSNCADKWPEIWDKLTALEV
jgi:hypothetical protein